MKEHEVGIINERGIFTIDGQTYSFNINENLYSKTFKVGVTLNSALFISIPVTKYLHKTIREVPTTSMGSNVVATGINEKEKINLVDDKNKANEFSSKEEAIEFVKEYIDQLKKEFLETEEILYEITKEDLL